MKALIPAYSQEFLDSCVKQSSKFGHVMAVIWNPDSGSGIVRDPAIARAIAALDENGVELLRYFCVKVGQGFSPAISRSGAGWKSTLPKKSRNKTVAELNDELAAYQSLYPAKGFEKFIENFVDNTTTRRHAEITRDSLLNNKKVCYNPGNFADAKNFSEFTADSVVVFEDNAKRLKNTKSDILAKAILTLNDKDYGRSLDLAQGMDAEYFFATDSAPDPWAQEPSYFKQLLAAF